MTTSSDGDIASLGRRLTASSAISFNKAATLSQAAAGYRDGTDATHRCRNCSMFLAQGDDEVGRCTLVQGDIRTDAVCDHWEAADIEKLGVKAWLPDLIKAGEGDEAATERLRHYWTHGEGGTAKIRWGEPGDFDRCVRHVGKYMENPQGYCAERHHDALGIWPATHAKEERANKVGPKGYIHGWIYVGAGDGQLHSDLEKTAKPIGNWHADVRQKADLNLTDEQIAESWVGSAGNYNCEKLQKHLMTGEGEPPSNWWGAPLYKRPDGVKGESMVKAMDAVISEHHLESDTELYRGMAVDQAFLDKFKPGMKIDNPGYMATTTDTSIANIYSNARVKLGHGTHTVIFKILVPKGTGYMPGDLSSKEVVLPRNGKLTVIRKEGDQIVAEFSS